MFNRLYYFLNNLPQVAKAGLLKVLALSVHLLVEHEVKNLAPSESSFMNS